MLHSRLALPCRGSIALTSPDLSPDHLVGPRALAYNILEAVRAASGLRNPFSAVGVGRDSTEDPLANGRGPVTYVQVPRC